MTGTTHTRAHTHSHLTTLSISNAHPPSLPVSRTRTRTRTETQTKTRVPLGPTLTVGLGDDNSDGTDLHVTPVGGRWVRVALKSKPRFRLCTDQRGRGV